MKELSRLTTQYINDEDRIRITGDIGPNHTVTLWLTQRLLIRAVEHLCKYIESLVLTNDYASQLKNSFAQQSAKAQIEPQAAVQIKSVHANWLVTTIDINFNNGFSILVLKGDNPTNEVALTLSEHALRQWLTILFEQSCKAEWPQTLWPDWIVEKQKSSSVQTAMLH
jgi:hypothetical protein